MLKKASSWLFHYGLSNVSLFYFKAIISLSQYSIIKSSPVRGIFSPFLPIWTFRAGYIPSGLLMELIGLLVIGELCIFLLFDKDGELSYSIEAFIESSLPIFEFLVIPS